MGVVPVESPTFHVLGVLLVPLSVLGLPIKWMLVRHSVR